jgi:penicillin G amidase
MKRALSMSVALLIAGCGGARAPLKIERGEYNQAAITVFNANGQNADWVLAEEQGYIQATDRFLQMDLTRRSGRGRAAELLGEKALTQDKEVHATGLPEAIERGEARLRAEHAEAHAMLVAYAKGVNRFIAEGKDAALLKTYGELTHDPKYQPRPWEPADSVAVGMSVAFYLSSYLQEKIALGAIGSLYLAGKDPFGWLKFTGFFDLRPLENVFILEADGRARGETVTAHGAAAKPGAPPALPGGGCLPRPFPFPECARRSGFGSNNWVVGPSLTGGKSSLLANDPHLPLTYPVSFYEIALDSKTGGGTIRARGLSLPGAPGVLIGHNDDIAWGFTNLTGDSDDVYIELLDDSGTSTDFKGGTVALEKKTVVLGVRQEDGSVRDESLDVRWVPHHGPLITDHLTGLQEKLAPVEAHYKRKVGLSYKWVGHRGGVELSAVLGLNRAKDFDEFRAALKNFEAGAQNVVYADRKGNIGYYGHALFPVRKYVSKLLPPFVPVPGDGKYEWEPEFRHELPELYNPSKGRIVTANNDPFGHSAKPYLSDYEDYFGWSFDVGSRAARLTELIDGTAGTAGKVTADDMRRFQFDHKDRGAARFIGLLKKNEAELELSDEAKRLKDRLFSWDGDASRHSFGATAAYRWIETLLPEYFRGLDKSNPERGELMAAHIAKTELGLKTAYHRLDEGKKRAVEILSASLDSAAKSMAASGEWGKRWGEVHQLQFVNRFPSLLPTFSFPSERDGSWTTVDVAGPGFGPNFRLVLEIPKEGGPIRGWNVMAGGNYGPTDKDGWRREMSLWLEGGSHELVPFSE